jgi:hypothetical protein
MILVFAGRRIDAADAKAARFPLASVDRVRKDLEQWLRRRQPSPSAVVGSAACGTDLLVLEEAGRLGIRRRVVLPFNRAAFRASSVVDRPGDWGPLFDAVITTVAAAGDLIELQFSPEDDTAYEQTNLEIFRQAEHLASSAGDAIEALVVWNGETRGSGDVTQAFLEEARRRQWPTFEIPSGAA